MKFKICFLTLLVLGLVFSTNAFAAPGATTFEIDLRAQDAGPYQYDTAVAMIPL